MGLHDKQPVNRRLSFSQELEAEELDRELGMGGNQHSPLPGVPGDGTPNNPIFIEEEDPESAPRATTGVPGGSGAVLFEGRLRGAIKLGVPERGMAYIIKRQRDGTTLVYSVPGRMVYIDEEGTDDDPESDSE